MAINDINKLRMLSLFEGNKVGENRVQPPVFGAPTPPSPAGDINAAQSYEDLFQPQPMPAPPQAPPDTLQYTPETASIEAYQKHLGQTPTYQDPGIWDRLIAGGLTLGNKTRGIPGGYEQGKKYLEAPYDREMEAWKAKATPLGTAATLENQRNVNSRNLAALELKERMDTRKQDETERKNQANEKIRQQNTDIQAMKAANPDYDFNFTGPKVIVTRPGSPTPIVTDIDTGNVTEMTKIIAAQKRAETMASAANTRNIASGAQLVVDEQGNPVSANPRDPTKPAVKIEGVGAIKKVPTGNRQPGEIAPARGDDLVRVRAMTAEAIRRIKKDFLVIPDKTKNPNAVATLNPGIKFRTGWNTWNPKQFEPESPELRARTAQKNLKDLLTLSLIGEMKEQSRTGATGFGQLTGRELNVLESAASRLDWAQDDVTLTDELNEILAKLERIMQPGKDEEGVATTPKRKETPAETIKRLGGG